MQTYDLAMLVILLGTMLFGFWKGMAWQLASLASLGVSYFAALNFSAVLAPYITADAPWNRFAAMLIIYVVSSVGIWMLFRGVAAAIDRVKLKEFDRQVGAIFGACKGLLFCLAITFFAVSLSATAREHILKTRSGYYAALAMDRAHPILPTEFRDLLEPYIHQLDGALPEDKRLHMHAHDETDPTHEEQAHEDDPVTERRDWSTGGEFASELERMAKDVIATEAAKRWSGDSQSPGTAGSSGTSARRSGSTPNVR